MSDVDTHLVLERHAEKVAENRGMKGKPRYAFFVWTEEHKGVHLANATNEDVDAHLARLRSDRSPTI